MTCIQKPLSFNLYMRIILVYRMAAWLLRDQPPTVASRVQMGRETGVFGGFGVGAGRRPAAGFLLLVCHGSMPAMAEDELTAALVTMLPTVNVVGDADRRTQIGGSADVLDAATLRQGHVLTTNEALRKLPGVNARDEEGLGLRPNIAVRGLNPTRSTKLTLLEDGVPLSYAPYGDNASYYHPAVERFERIELLKGPQQLLYGPQTIGGTINYLTPAPRAEFGGYARVAAGERAYRDARLQFGGRNLLFDYLRKQGDGSRRNMHSEIDDLNLKAAFNIGASQAVVVRANYYGEDSVITYSGLTQAEYEQLGRDYNPFANDSFAGGRFGLSATHELSFRDSAGQLTTNYYYAHFSRDWWRQSSTTTDTQCGAAFAARRLAGLAVDVGSCNSAQGRLRDYRTWGVEPRLTYSHALGGATGQLSAGARWHQETQDRLQVNASSSLGRSGTLAESNLRRTEAASMFLQYALTRASVGIAPILRYEHIHHERRNRLNGDRGADSLGRVLWGLGATWNPGQQLTVFADVHRGFAPPRTEDLIGATGTSTEVGAEESVNAELGFRYRFGADGALQATLFRSDFSRLVAVGSIAGGSTPLAVGEALFQGLEVSGTLPLSRHLQLRGAWTFLPTAEQGTAYRRVDNGAVANSSVAGNRQPYAPEHTLTLAAAVNTGPVSAQLELQQVGAQYSDFAETVAPSADGQRGRIAGFGIWNLSSDMRLSPALSAYVSVKNLLDRNYIADRTRGIQVGMPRLVQLGLRYDFGGNR